MRHGLVILVLKQTEGTLFWSSPTGQCIALSGSCSNATRAQVALHSATHPFYEIDATKVIEGRLTAEVVVDWLLSSDGIPLAFSSAEPAAVSATN